MIDRQEIRVVEAAEVPRTTIAGGMFVPVPEGGMEPVGSRIIEVPENTERTEKINEFRKTLLQISLSRHHSRILDEFIFLNLRVLRALSGWS